MPRAAGEGLHIHTGELANASAIAPTHRQFRPVPQHYEYRTPEPLVHLQYALDVDDRGAMDAQETARVETLFDVADRLAHEVRRAGRVQAHVLPFRLDP